MSVRLPRLFVASALMLLAGCASVSSVPLHTNGKQISGHVMGGQQPVTGATIQLYAVGTAGDASAATPLLTRAVTTDVTGNFYFTTADYSCTNAGLTYITATGGNPGLAANGVNPNLALLAVVGQCSSITDSTVVNINELTTVAGVYAVTPYISALPGIGAAPAHSSALSNAFTLANQFVDTSTGLSPGNNVPTGDTVPTAVINTLGDIIGTCVNSAGGSAGDSTPCGQLFSLTTPTGTQPPTDTVAALILLAANPGLNTQQLFSLVSAAGPFQPTSSTLPPDFRVRLDTPASQHALQFSAAGLTFQTTTTGTTSAAQSITITNSSAAAVTLSPLTTTGANASDFAASSNCGASLAAGANCLAQVTFTPAAAGTRSAYLAVNSNTPDSPQYLPLTATGQNGTPHVKFSVQSLNFTTAGSTQDVTMTNTGTGVLSVSGIATGTPYFTQTNTCGTSLAPNGTCVISVVDQVPGPRLISYPLGGFDFLAVQTNDTFPNTGVFLNLSGLVNSASYSTSSLVFAPTVVGSSNPGPTFTRTLTNTTSCPYLTFTGAFEVSGPVTNGKSLNNVSCTYTTSFHPTAAGPQSAKVQVDGNGGYLLMSGLGLASQPANVTLTPALNLSNNTPGNLTLSNLDIAPLGIQSVTAAPGLMVSNNCGTSLPAQSVCTIIVTSTSTLTAPPEGLVTVTHDKGTSSASVAASNDFVYDFGAAAVGTTSPVTYSITANALDIQNGEQASITASGDFMGSSCNQVRSQSCTAQVTFKPQATGIRMGSGTLAESYSGSGSSYSPSENVRFTGVGAASGPLLFIKAPQVSKMVGVTSNVSVTLYNSGTAALDLTRGATLSGPNASDFVASPSQTSCPAPFAVGSSCTVTLQFAPQAVGTKTATLNYTDKTSGQSFAGTLTAVGTYPPPSSPYANYTFPNTPANTSAPPITRSITDFGNHPLTLAFTSGQNAFTLSRTSCAQDETPCDFQITFTPPASNTFYDGHLVYTDTVSGLSATYEVTGTSSPNATATLNPSSLTFAARPVGSTSIAQTVTLGNSGTDPFTISAITLGGANASEFSMTKTCGTSLAAKASCSISVTFAPTTSGSKAASITITGNAPNLPLTVPITGSAQ